MPRRQLSGIVCLVLASCSQVVERDPEQQLLSQDAAKIELFVPGKPLPPEATNVYYQDWAGMDSYQVVRFDLPVGKAQIIMQELTGLKAEPITPEMAMALGGASGSPPSWWKISQAPKGALGAQKNTCWPLRYIIVPGEERARVYFSSSTC